MEPDDKTLTITGIDGTTDTITIDLSDTYSTLTMSTPYPLGDISVNSYTVDTIDIDWDKISINNITLEPTMWEDCMPDPQKLKKMCEQYPALEKAYENFKTVYSMVEQDWKGNHDEDELSF